MQQHADRIDAGQDVRPHRRLWKNSRTSPTARALLAARETDEAAAAAWDDRMGAVRESCRVAIEALHRDGMLAPEWSRDEAVDLMWTMLSIRNWEQLTIECGWSSSQYVGRMQKLLKRALVRGPEET